MLFQLNRKDIGVLFSNPIALTHLKYRWKKYVFVLFVCICTMPVMGLYLKLYDSCCYNIYENADMCAWPKVQVISAV